MMAPARMSPPPPQGSGRNADRVWRKGSNGMDRDAFPPPTSLNGKGKRFRRAPANGLAWAGRP